MGVITGVPDAIVEDFQIIAMLPVCASCFGGVGVDQSATIKRCEQPFVWINDEAVSVFDAVEQGARGGRRQCSTAVGTIDMQPDLLLLTDITNALHVVDDAKIGGASGARYGEESCSVMGVERGNGGFHVGSG